MLTKFNKGFTLIELLVVIAIIGLLASIVLVSVQGVREKARDARRKQDLTAVRTALEMYQVKYNKYPPETNWCDSSVGIVGSTCPPSPLQNDWGATSDLRVLITSGFLGNLPKDPLNNSTYYYYFEPDGIGQGTPPCQISGCRWTLCANKLEKTGTSYCLKSMGY